MKAIGLGPWTKNAKYCTGCFRVLRRSHGGAEVECTLLFADVRGSTPLAEQMRPRDFNRLMGRFYDTAIDVLGNHDAIVDKFVVTRSSASSCPRWRARSTLAARLMRPSSC
jgi:hypothetical protein